MILYQKSKKEKGEYSMRKVKCRVTGETGYDLIFYKAPNGHYYKSKEIYENFLNEQDLRKKILTLINTKILHKPINNYAGLINKLIKESGLDYSIIYNFIAEKVDYINKRLNPSESDSSKIIYIFSSITKSYNNTIYAGCYEIRNKKTSEVYIGESINLFYRFTEHIAELYENRHHCKKLQDAFNETHSIHNFIITPLFLFPITDSDKKIIKQETLYLESAFFLAYKNNKEIIYNTKNPYKALKENDVFLDDYKIDCSEVLKLIYEDKYKIIPKNISEPLKIDLLNYINYNDSKPDDESQNLTDENHNFYKDIEKQIQITDNLLKDGIPLFRVHNILNEFAENGILPKDFDYSKIRNILVDNNFIYIDEYGHTVATEYSLKNNLYLISKATNRNSTLVYNYYVTEKCKNLLLEIFKKIPKDSLRKNFIKA